MESASLLGPPTTINVKNDNIHADDDYDDDRRLRNHDDTGPTIDAVHQEVEAPKPSSWNKENRDFASPDIESVIHSFNEELENLSRSFDLLASTQASYVGTAPHIAEQRAAAPSGSQSRRPSYSHYSSSSKQMRPKMSTRASTDVSDPPLSAYEASPFRFSAGGTPARSGDGGGGRSRTPYDATSASYRSYQPSDPPPPRPVDTPAVDRAVGGSNGYTPTTTTPSRRNYNISRGTPRTSSSKRDDSAPRQSTDWEVAFDKLNQTLKKQERDIEELKRENDGLKRQLSQQRSNDQDHRDGPLPSSPSYGGYFDRGGSFSVGAGGFAPPSGGRRHQGAHYDNTYYDEDAIRRPPSSSFSTLRTAGPLSTPPRDEDVEGRAAPTPPRRIDVIPEEYVGFTPGTRFVAELVRLMQFEIGHHAPLSVIIDKHWDRLRYTMREDIGSPGCD